MPLTLLPAPRIQKAIYTSVHGATNTISQKFSQASLNFQLFFFRLVDVCKSFFHFPISKYVLPSTLALPPCRCKFASVSIKKWLLSSSNIRQKKLAIWCGFLGRKILWSLLQNISSSKHSVLYHISQNKKDALKLHVTIKSDSCHKTFVSSNCTYISTIVVSYL